MNKRTILCAVLCLMAASVLAVPPPAYRITVERQSTASMPALYPYQASYFTLRASFTDGGSPVVLGAGDVPAAWWAWSNRAGGVVTASWATVSAASGTVDFTWSPSAMNTNGVAMYGIGITDSNGAFTVLRQGTFAITPDPYAAGVDPVSYATGVVNWALATWLNTPGWVTSMSVVTGATWGAEIVTNHLTLTVSTNATGELDPVWTAASTGYLTAVSAAATYATTSAVAIADALKTDVSAFNSTNSGFQSQLNALVTSAGWTQAVVQGETAFIALSNTARQLYLTVAGIAAKADSNTVWATFAPVATYSAATAGLWTAVAGKLDAASYSNSAVVTDRVSALTYTANRATDTASVAVVAASDALRLASSVWLSARATDTNRISSLDTNVAARLPTATHTAYTAAYAVADSTTNYQRRDVQLTNNTAMQARIATVETGKASLVSADFTGPIYAPQITTPLFSWAGTGATWDINFVGVPNMVIRSNTETYISVHGRTLVGPWVITNKADLALLVSTGQTLYATATNRAPYADYRSTSNTVAQLSSNTLARTGGIGIGTYQLSSVAITNTLTVAATNTLGSELVTDGGFAASPLPWTLTACYTNNQQLVTDAGLSGTFAPSTAVSAVVGAWYQISLTNASGAGSVVLVFGGVTNSLLMPFAHATISVQPITTEGFSGRVNATNQSIIDAVSVKRSTTGSAAIAGKMTVGDTLTVAGAAVADSFAWNGGQSTNVVAKTGSVMSGPLATTRLNLRTDGLNPTYASGSYPSLLTQIIDTNDIVYAYLLNQNTASNAGQIIGIGESDSGGRYSMWATLSTNRVDDGLSYPNQPGVTWLEARSWQSNAWPLVLAAPSGRGFVDIYAGSVYHTSRVARFNWDGKVGIGTNTPRANLHVNGDSLLNGPVRMSNTLDVASSVMINGESIFINGEAGASGIVATNSPSFLFAGPNVMFYGGDINDGLEERISFSSNRLYGAWRIGLTQLSGSNGTLYVNGTNVFNGTSSGATGSIVSLTLGGSNYSGGTPSLQIVGGGVATAYVGEAATFTIPTGATGTPLYVETYTGSVGSVAQQIADITAVGLKATQAFNQAAAPNGAAVTNVPSAWTTDTGYNPTNSFAPTLLGQVGGTVSIYRTGANLFRYTATSTPIVVTFDTAGWADTDLMSARLELFAGTNTITFPAATIRNYGAHSSTSLVLSTTGWNSLLFDKGYGTGFPARVYQLQ